VGALNENNLASLQKQAVSQLIRFSLNVCVCFFYVFSVVSFRNPASLRKDWVDDVIRFHHINRYSLRSTAPCY
jgi:hypothetical protein